MCQRDVEFLGMSFIGIAGVVTGSQLVKLTGWERAEAIRAMHALHWRAERMQRALCIGRRWYLYQVGRKLGVELQESDAVDELSLTFIEQGSPMRVEGVTRVEAIRRLAATRTSSEIAALTMCTGDVIRYEAARAGVMLIPARPVECWWSSYAETHSLAVPARG